VQFAHVVKDPLAVYYHYRNHIIFCQGKKGTLADKVTDIHQKRYDLANTIKAQERRLSTLNRNLEQLDVFNQHKAVFKKIQIACAEKGYCRAQ